MSWQTWTLAILIVVFVAVQYAMAWNALDDLLHRPRVRGGSHLLWVLVIVCVPVIGALIYGINGPTSLRSNQILTADEPAAPDQLPDPPPNVTPFRRYSGKMSDRISPSRPGLTRSRAHSDQRSTHQSRKMGA